MQVEAGQRYWFALDGADDSVGATALRLRLNVDNDPPETTIDDGPPALSNASAATIRFSADETGSTFECRFDGGVFAACESPWSRSSLAEGEHTFEVRATDRAGNVDETPARSVFTFDRTPPPVAIDQAPRRVHEPARRQPGVRVDRRDGDVHVRVRRGAGRAVRLAASRGPGSPTAATSSCCARPIRPTNATSRTVIFTVDTVAPNTTLSPVPRDPTNEAAPVIGFRSETGATFECSIGEAAFAPCASPLTLSGLGEGDHLVRVRATDRAGNVEVDARAAPVRDRPHAAGDDDPGVPDRAVPLRRAASASRRREDGRVECQIDDDPWRTARRAPRC